MTTTLPAPNLAPRPPSRRVPVWVTVLIALVSAGVLGMVLFVGAVVVGLSGGIDDVFTFTKPTEDSREVKRARETAAEQAGALQEKLVTTLATGRVGDTRVRVERDDCQVGQHNWKIDDPYDLDCTLARGSVHVVDEASVTDVTAQLGPLLESWTMHAGSSQTAARWTRGGDGTEQAAGAEEVAVVLLDATRPLQYYALGASYAYDGEPTGITRDSRPYLAEQLSADHPGQKLVVVTVTQRYFYE